MKRLTDGMKNEMYTIDQRIIFLCFQFIGNVPAGTSRYQLDNMLSRLNSQHGYEVETYKVKLENFYSETDVKEQTFQGL